MIGAVLLMMAVGLVIASAVCVVLLRFSERRGWIDAAGGEAHKRHDRAVANTGGVGIFWAVAIPMVAVFVAAWAVPKGVWPQAIEIHILGLRSQTRAGALLLFAMTFLHMVGLLDDRRTLGPWSKLAAQFLVAGVLVGLADMRILHMLNDYGALGVAISALVSTLWIVLIINAFNFLDNMDGLSGGVAMILCGLYIVITLAGGQWFVAGLCALLAGALAAFLWFNLPPARLFMGDGGSLVVGLLMAIISIRTTYFDPEFGDQRMHALLMPVVMMAVPLYDMISVTLVRTWRGDSPMHADHNHFSHRLVRLGLSRRRAVGIVWLCTLVTGMSGVIIGELRGEVALLAGIQAGSILVLLAMLEMGAHRRRS